MDEATSALDRQTEMDVAQAMQVLKDSMTLIVISHNEKSITSLDNLLNMNDRGKNLV